MFFHMFPTMSVCIPRRTLLFFLHFKQHQTAKRLEMAETQGQEAKAQFRKQTQHVTYGWLGFNGTRAILRWFMATSSSVYDGYDILIYDSPK